MTILVASFSQLLRLQIFHTKQIASDKALDFSPKEVTEPSVLCFGNQKIVILAPGPMWTASSTFIVLLNYSNMLHFIVSDDNDIVSMGSVIYFTKNTISLMLLFLSLIINKIF